MKRKHVWVLCSIIINLKNVWEPCIGCWVRKIQIVSTFYLLSLRNVSKWKQNFIPKMKSKIGSYVANLPLFLLKSSFLHLLVSSFWQYFRLYFYFRVKTNFLYNVSVYAVIIIFAVMYCIQVCIVMLGLRPSWPRYLIIKEKQWYTPWPIKGTH